MEKQLGLKFTLDVCASEKSAKAVNYYTEEDDAFEQDWKLDSNEGAAWCNPPFLNMGRWVERAKIFAIRRLNTVILAPANKTDQPWFHQFVLPHAEIWAVKGRLQFLDPETGEVPIREKEIRSETGEFLGSTWVKSGNSQGSHLYHFGPNVTPGRIRSFVWKN